MTDAFARWELQARLSLADRGMTRTEVTPLIEAAEADWRGTGRPPVEILGDPREFAASVAAARPAAARGAVDRAGMSARDHLTGGLFVTTAVVVVATVLAAALERSWSLPVTPAGATGSMLVLAALAAAGSLPAALRTAGRPRWAPWSHALAAVLVGVAGAAFTVLPDTRLVAVPVPAVLAVGALALGAQLRPSRRRLDDPVDEAGAQDPEVWLHRLGGLLTGRHDLSPARAGELVAETRDHLELSGASPLEEFGPVASYAADLADGMPGRRRRVRPAVKRLWLGVAATAVLLGGGIGLWADAHPVLAVACWSCAAASAVAVVRPGLRARSSS